MAKTLRYYRLRALMYVFGAFCGIYGLVLGSNPKSTTTFAQKMGVAALFSATFMWLSIGIYLERLGEAEDGYRDRTTKSAVITVIFGLLMSGFLVAAELIKS